MTKELTQLEAEMLEVLKAIEESGFLHDLNGDDSGGHLLSLVRLAIAKANGRDQ